LGAGLDTGTDEAVGVAADGVSGCGATEALAEMASPVLAGAVGACDDGIAVGGDAGAAATRLLVLVAEQPTASRANAAAA
jgi:hypothetical protein